MSEQCPTVRLRDIAPRLLTIRDSEAVANCMYVTLLKIWPSQELI